MLMILEPELSSGLSGENDGKRSNEEKAYCMC